jgi:hypothetical protein
MISRPPSLQQFSAIRADCNDFQQSHRLLDAAFLFVRNLPFQNSFVVAIPVASNLAELRHIRLRKGCGNSPKSLCSLIGQFGRGLASSIEIALAHAASRQ